MTIALKEEVAAQIRDALVAALRAHDGEREGKSALTQTREQEGRLREALRLLDEQQESAALEKALRAMPAHLLATLEGALGLALARARDRICTDPGEAGYDRSQAQALEELEHLHAEVRRVMTIP
jgi:hypothetical protein